MAADRAAYRAKVRAELERPAREAREAERAERDAFTGGFRRAAMGEAARFMNEWLAARAYVGTVGARVTFEAKLVGRFPFESAYGDGTVFSLRTREGNAVAYITNGYPGAVEVGEWLRVTATIKEHGMYGNEKQTKIQRAKFAVLEPEEEACAA
jgi:hypothetical protein